MSAQAPKSLLVGDDSSCGSSTGSKNSNSDGSGSSNCCPKLHESDAAVFDAAFAAKFESGEFGMKNLQDHFIYLGHDHESIGQKRCRSRSFWGQCRNCGVRIKSNGSSGYNLERHIEFTHKLILRFKETAPVTPKTPDLAKKVTKADASKQAAFTSLLISEYIGKDGYSFEDVQKEGFRKLIQAIAPHLTMPSTAHLKAELDTVIVGIRPKNKALLAKTHVNTVNLSFERWSDNLTKIVCYSIGDDFKLNKMLLGFNVLVDGALEQILEEAGIALSMVSFILDEDISVIISMLNLDNLFNGKPWLPTLKSQEKPLLVTHEAVIGTIITKCVTSSFVAVLNRAWAKSDEKSANLVLKLNSWVTFILEFPERAEEFNSLPVVRFRLDSFFWILKCLKEPESIQIMENIINQAKNDGVCSAEELTPPTNEDVELLKEFTNLIEPLEVAIVRFQEDGPIAPVIVPYILMTFMKIQQSNVDHLKNLKDAILGEMANEFSSWLTNPELMVATVLHPRFKMSLYKGQYTDEFRTYPEFKVPDYFKVWMDIENLLFPSNGTEPMQDEEFSMLSVPTYSSEALAGREELSKYVEEPIILGQLNPLDFWRTRKNVYPTLANVVKSYFALPITMKIKELYLTASRSEKVGGNPTSDLFSKLLTLSLLNQAAE